jgi:hypothetical protein
MLLKQLLSEMPVAINTELVDSGDEPFTVFFMSDDTMKRRGYREIGKKGKVHIMLSKNNQICVAGFEDIRHDGTSGFKVLGMLEFKMQLNLGIDLHTQGQMVQVELVEVSDQFKELGLGSFMYHRVVQSGLTLVSDNQQYLGGQSLWRKIAKAHMADEVVYVMQKGKLLSDSDGQPIEYDGKNIPDSSIWSEDATHKHTLLIYTKRG